MSWISKGLGIAVLGTLVSLPTLPTVADAQARGRARVAGPRAFAGSRVVIRPRTSFGFGLGFYGDRYYPYGYYPYGPAYAVVPATGEVKIDTRVKDAVLYVDGGYVGPASKFKKFALKPGNYSIELRDASGNQFYNQRVEVILNKSVEIKPGA